jgi:UDP-N-acetylglucosamine diphosphorylase / glucose-1-phosphate thymidylyltransferase / UDP-N-acetylgalactosamine diphosphorylase / glucosamine-1-phosphate N-acetyltransferase / galactosamine-1-phosphate N-acetyltransferase
VNWIFPIAGHGTRTSSLGGYKPFIEVFNNYNILKLCLVTLRVMINPDDRIVFIASETQERQYKVRDNIQKLLKEINLSNKADVVILDKTPHGQALTVKEGVTQLGNELLNEGTFVINSDQIVFFDLDDVELDKCSVGVYFNQSSSSCFFELDIEKRQVRDAKEKRKISGYASAGIFYFTRAAQMLAAIEWGLAEHVEYSGELYLGPCMEYFDDLSYFQALVKFDLGNEKKVQLFRRLCSSMSGIK